MINIKDKLLEYLKNIQWFVRNIEFKNIFKAIINIIVKFWRHTVLIMAIIVLLYYPLGALINHKINDDPSFAPKEQNIENLLSITSAINLINREVNQNLWTDNLPFFFPGAILDNMPSYQTGIIASTANFVKVLARYATDQNLQDAAKLLEYPTNIWIIDFSRSWLPMASTNKKYREAIRELSFYNDNLANSAIKFNTSEQLLKNIILNINNDIHSMNETILKQINIGQNNLIDCQDDNVFYNNKGRIYAYYIILKALETDFVNVIETTNISQDWSDMMTDLKQTALLKPIIVINSKADASFLPSHLTAQGFYLMQAYNKLSQIYYKIGNQ